MTELLEGGIAVRTGSDGMPAEVGGSRVAEIAATWRVDTGWWREPVRRDYVRCLLADGGCIDIYRDLQTGAWHRERRYD